MPATKITSICVVWEKQFEARYVVLLFAFVFLVASRLDDALAAGKGVLR